MWKKALSVPVQLLCWAGIALDVWGMPSAIAERTTWFRWLGMIPDAVFIVLFVAGIVSTGPLLWTSHWWWPKLFPRKQPPRLKAWLARDNSITLEQAAFLWEGIPHQDPLPALVQNQMAQLLNAVQTGMLKGYTPPSTFAGLIAFAAFGKDVAHIESPSRATRVDVKELKRWAQSIGDVPEFLDDA